MADSGIMRHSEVTLRSDPSRTVIRPFAPQDPPAYAIEHHARVQRIADRVLALDGGEVSTELATVMASLRERHRDVEALLERQFDETPDLTLDRGAIGHDRALLLGAYFSEEYSFEAAALFNPSMVLHPDQEGLPAGTIRFALSLRGIGEGHVSSVTFRRGTWGPDNAIVFDAVSRWAVPPRISKPNDGDPEACVRLVCEGSRDLSETVLFPVTPSQHQGIEDVRLVRFTEEDGTSSILGTYTAFSGSEIRSELLEAEDLRNFTMRPLQGKASANKGMALFPRRVDGRYTMLGRQDNESIWLMRSDDLFTWEEAEKIVSPKFPWEFIQMGNCGSPIEIDEGWLVITHGVGTVRNYCMGACLLDKDDPSKVLGRMAVPLLEPSPRERDGYVPNVVYSCGGIVQDRTLLLPYGVADSFATFASGPVDAILKAMS